MIVKFKFRNLFKVPFQARKACFILHGGARAVPTDDASIFPQDPLKPTAGVRVCTKDLLVLTDGARAFTQAPLAPTNGAAVFPKDPLTPTAGARVFTKDLLVLTNSARAFTQAP